MAQADAGRGAPRPGLELLPTAACIVIGNEILSGKTADTNSGFLARELYALGVGLRRILVVPDEHQEIVAALRSVQPRYDWVFTSGGVGPTHDDITLEAVAQALGRGLERNPGLAERIARHYDVGRNPLALRMADLPQGAVLIESPATRVPVVQVENVFVLPGVPAIFERKLVAIRDRFRAAPFHLRQVFLRVGEVEIAQSLYDLVARHPGLGLGSYPVLDQPEYEVKLTLESRDRELVERALADLLLRLPAGAVVRTA